jgi:hypothetical protein
VARCELLAEEHGGLSITVAKRMGQADGDTLAHLACAPASSCRGTSAGSSTSSARIAARDTGDRVAVFQRRDEALEWLTRA